jgi:hypothetical protein
MLGGRAAGANRDLTNGHPAVLNEHGSATNEAAVVRQLGVTVRQIPEAAGGMPA